MRGTLLDPASVVYRDVTRQAKGLYRLKHEVALKRGLAYLSRCNSDWCCHIGCHTNLADDLGGIKLSDLIGSYASHIKVNPCPSINPDDLIAGID
jgi:hypothetical protein